LIPETARQMPFVAMLREGTLRNDWELRQMAAERITELEGALRDVVRDVNDYERVNNLAPNPGRSECWDSVGRAKTILAKTA
jgi:hypothetical protein